MSNKVRFVVVNAINGDIDYASSDTEANSKMPKASGFKNFYIYKGFTKSDVDNDKDKKFAEAAKELIETNNIDTNDLVHLTENITKELDTRTNNLSDNQAIVITDGSYKDGEMIGFGWVSITKSGVDSHSDNRENEKLASHQNVSAEIVAVENAINWAAENDIKRLDIYYDLLDLVGWAVGYETKKELTKKYKAFLNNIKETKNMKIVFHKVPAHEGIKYNEEADKLAKDALKK